MIKPNIRLRIRVPRIAIRFVRRFWWQLTALSLGIIVLTVVVAYHNAQYSLSKTELTLVTRSTVNAKLIKETATEVSYNRAAEQTSSTPKVVLAAAQDATGQTPYKAVLAKNGSQAVTFSDSQGDLSFTMTPTSKTAAGRQEQGRIIYPEGLNVSHIYTFKRNGVKEDIPN